MTSFAFEIKHLVKNYPGYQLGPVDLILPQGHVLGLVGPNGAGKSTMINILSGLVKPDDGEVIVLGENATQLKSKTRAKIGLVRDEPPLAEDAKVDYLLKFTSQFHAQWDKNYIQDLLKHFRIDVHKKVKELSKGTKLKLSVVLALSYQPELLLLDEPFSGLDLIAKKELRDVLQVIKDSQGTSILLSSHNIAEIEKLCDTVVLLSHGRIILNENLQNLVSSWQKWEFDTDGSIQPPAEIRSEWQNQLRFIWVLENCKIDMMAYLTENHAMNAKRAALSLEEIFTILLSESELQ